MHLARLSGSSEPIRSCVGCAFVFLITSDGGGTWRERHAPRSERSGIAASGTPSKRSPSYSVIVCCHASAVTSAASARRGGNLRTRGPRFLRRTAFPIVPSVLTSRALDTVCATRTAELPCRNAAKRPARSAARSQVECALLVGIVREHSVRPCHPRRPQGSANKAMRSVYTRAGGPGRRAYTAGNAPPPSHCHVQTAETITTAAGGSPPDQDGSYSWHATDPAYGGSIRRLTETGLTAGPLVTIGGLFASRIPAGRVSLPRRPPHFKQNIAQKTR